MKSIVDALHNWGLELGYMIGGFFGSLIFMNTEKNKKRPKWEKVIIVITGILAANYVTPLLIWLLQVPAGVQYGVSFVIGYMGLNGLGLIIDTVRDKIKKK